MSALKKVAKSMYDREKARVDRLCEAADASVGKKVHVSAMLSFESCNLLYEDQARAALEALLEPSEGMEDAADALDPSGVPYSPGSPREVFRAMIQAALDGK